MIHQFLKDGLQRFTKVSEHSILIIVTIVIGIVVVAWKKMCLITRFLIALIVMIQIAIVSIAVVVVISSLKIFDISDTIMCDTLVLGPKFGFAIVVCLIV